MDGWMESGRQAGRQAGRQRERVVLSLTSVSSVFCGDEKNDDQTTTRGCAPKIAVGKTR